MILSFFRYFIWRIMFFLPGNRLYYLRASLWRLAGFKVDKTARIVNCARLIYGDICIGKDTFVGAEALITGGRISIGDNCDIAPRVIIHAGSHELGTSQRRAGKAYTGSIEIGDGCWIGTGAILIDGAKIGKGSIVAAGSLVKDIFPDNVLIAGVPAEIKKQLL